MFTADNRSEWQYPEYAMSAAYACGSDKLKVGRLREVHRTEGYEAPVSGDHLSHYQGTYPLATLTAYYQFTPPGKIAGDAHVTVEIYSSEDPWADGGTPVARQMQFMCDECEPAQCELASITGLAEHILDGLDYEVPESWHEMDEPGHFGRAETRKQS